ncbi:unnamed protein product [Phaeothamnion confervicola]
MIIPIRVDGKSAEEAGGSASPESAPALPEWSMIELNGVLKSKDALAGQGLGRLSTTNDKPTLVIGSSLLEGKVAKLPKPVLVLQRVRQDRKTTEYRIVGKLGRKIIFKNRPKPIVLRKKADG